MFKKENQLIRKQQISRKMSRYLSNKDTLKAVWNVRSIHDKLNFDDILMTWNNAYRQNSQEIY